MLRAEAITKTYGDVIALDRVSLTLARGQRLGLVGPSGSGKSTLAQILAALQRSDAGTVTVDGERIETWGVRVPRRLRLRTQLVFQAPRVAVDPRLRLGAAIVEPLAAGGLDDREGRRDLWAARTGLTPDLLERFPHEVSEGQLQRACLARALIVDPGYLICDELSSMLDVSTQAALLETIAAAQSELGLGVLLITHDAVLADAWCDVVVDIRALTARCENVAISARSASVSPIHSR
ncbi:MAG TPA: ATP-binding cassette domain-containing protein [Solirubrobacter sp.]|nr:ATP-binding cassette domain-containing protein [Solirubrobacter sp.]